MTQGSIGQLACQTHFTTTSKRLSLHAVAHQPFLVFDIETVVDPELPIVDAGEAGKLPAAPHHKIVTIGALLLAADYTPKRLGIVGRETTDEAAIVREFSELVTKHEPTLVTYNGRGFDLPVIAMRCLRHGVPFAAYYRSRDMRYRFNEAGHFDLMDYLSDYGATKQARLDVVAKLCGMPGKVGVDGKDVGPMVHAGRLDEVRNYCLCDVVQTAAVFLRVEFLRGALDERRYVDAMRQLIEMTQKDERVAPVAEALNVDRLLLGHPAERSEVRGDSSSEKETPSGPEADAMGAEES
jgi:3'-5' exonuclease